MNKSNIKLSAGIVLGFLAVAGILKAAQTNYLGTVFLADPTTQSQQMSVNADGSIKANVGGYEFKATSTPTVQNASYVSGNCLGGFNTLTVSRTTGGGVILNNISVRSVAGSVPTLTLYIFDANPSASTCTDKSTFTLNSADISKIPANGVQVVNLVAPTGATPSFGAAANVAISMIAGGSSASGVQTIYYALVSGSTFTPGSVTDIQVTANGIQD